MARKRRPFEVFSMSFLDCMSCGFGAVILFFMIINAQVNETTEMTLRSDGRDSQLEIEILDGRKNLVLAKNTMEDLTEEKETAEGQIAQIIALIEELRAELASTTLRRWRNRARRKTAVRHQVARRRSQTIAGDG